MHNMAFYDIVYVITNIFGTYVIYKFMNIFFERNNINYKLEIVSYLIYFCLITIIYISIRIPIVMTVSNICFFFLLSLNYKANFKKRIICVLLIYLILMCIEMIVVFFTGYFEFPILKKGNFSSVFGIVIIKILSYILVLVLSNFNNIKKGVVVNNAYWFCIAFIPVSTLYFLFIMFSSNIKVYDLIIGTSIMLFINFSVFYFYDYLSQFMVEKTEKLIFKKQNEYYSMQLSLMESSMMANKAIKHDIANHLLVIQSYVNNGQYDEIKLHLSDSLYDHINKKEYSNSGNTAIDSIINFKLQDAFQHKVNISTDISIPEKLNFSSHSATIILGNLLDNAINALNKVENEKDRYLFVKLKYSKGRLIMKIVNSFNGVVIDECGKFKTTHNNKDEHGFGMKNVYNEVEKYGGVMDINYEKNLFQVMIIIYID